MPSGFKRKASEEVASPESGQQASKKARTDSPENEVRSLEFEILHVLLLTITPSRKMVFLRKLPFELFRFLRRYVQPHTGTLHVYIRTYN